MRGIRGFLEEVLHLRVNERKSAVARPWGRMFLGYGWISYFRLAQNKVVLEELDGWVRRRLCCLLWRQWKRPRTRQERLRGTARTVVWEGGGRKSAPYPIGQTTS